MSLLTSYGSANAVTHTALYTRTQCSGKIAEKDSTQLWEWHRYRTKGYSVVGMTYAAAVACANAAIALLTRNFNVWEVDTENATATSSVRSDMMADVVVAHDEGSMWHVDVSVNEDDVYYHSSGSAAPSFPSAPTTNYDPPEGSVTTTTT